ncbi:GNAT family N-acetyltransferase [uncultured Sulfitobacter sp.]|uniref:GNAT family N-acetyltransferase n=1 Tax=uncultured Sulfitobacter sp. TaxID=191468 RepID=UPI0026152E51|nr:GNAT family N-acetyltransferase [uncultured Sulfitobacter sp.]
MLENGLFAVPKGKVAVVVTSLEMHVRPLMKQIDLPEDITFCQVTPTVEWYRDLFTRVGGLDWLWYGRLKMDDTTLQTILADPKRAFFTLTKDGKDEALLELHFQDGGDCELAYFGLTAALIGTGAGRYLMNEAITRAWDAAIRRFHVHTCTHDSPQALGFYIRSGFAPYKREVDIDDDPRLTGVLPADSCKNIPII